MLGISYWFLPLFSSLVWLGMLLGMFVTWVTKGKPRYPSMVDGQTIAYISDIGAQELKPLFITMSTVTVVVLDVALFAERWLRHSGRLIQNTSMFQKVLSALSSVCAVAGAAGLILLAIFDTLRYHNLHNVFLCFFIGGYVLSAIFICWEYQRLGIHFREHRILRISFWIKLVFILVEIALAIGFGLSQRKGNYNIAAILEWIIALLFTFYVFSFFVDFIPAVQKNNRNLTNETAEEMAYTESEQGLHQPSLTGGLARDNSTAQGGRTYDGPLGYPHVNGMNGHTHGHVKGGEWTAGGTHHLNEHPGETVNPEVPASKNF